MPNESENVSLNTNSSTDTDLPNDNERSTKAISAKIEKGLYIKAKHYAFDRDLKFNELIEKALRSLVIPTT